MSKPDKDELNVAQEVEIKHTLREHHDWRQQGTTIICESCPNRHAAEIPPEHILRKSEVTEKLEIVPIDPQPAT